MGIVQRDGYLAASAKSGDTVADVALRIGMSPSALGAYNGLAPSDKLRDGDELVLPPEFAISGPVAGSPGGALPGGTAWSPDLANAAIERSTTPTEPGALVTAPAPESAASPNAPVVPAPGVEAQGDSLARSRPVWTLARDQTPSRRTAVPIQ